ncbi:MAG TPA: hypothetical protein VIO57_13930 [Chloroflexota bacterium]
MNAVYAILESKYRWLSLAGISFTAGCVGAMMMLAFEWRHEVALVSLYLGLLLTVFFGVRAFLEWKSAAEASLNPRSDGRQKERRPTR